MNLSVITPTYNCASYIPRSYWCLCQQTYDKWEWVVVDDGSTDETAEIMAKLSRDDQRVKYHKLEKNMGRGFARNFAVSRCASEKIVVWDVDDFYVKTRLAKISAAFEAGFDFICSYSLIVDLDLGIKGARHFEGKGTKISPSFVHPTLAFKLSVVKGIPYDQTMRAGEDLELMIYLERNCRGYYIKEYLLLYNEEREIDISKTISMHSSHIKSVERMMRGESTGFTFWDRARIGLRLYLKWLLLQIFRLAPSLYLKTVPYRYMDRVKGVLLGEEHILIFKRFGHAGVK